MVSRLKKASEIITGSLSETFHEPSSDIDQLKAVYNKYLQ